MRRKRRISAFSLGSGATLTLLNHPCTSGASLKPGVLPREVTQLPALETIIGSQVTDSDGHQWPPLKGGGSRDVGGGFFTQKQYAFGDRGSTQVLSQTGAIADFPTWCQDRIYQGPVWPRAGLGKPGSYNFPPALLRTDSELNQLGAVAISRCKPGEELVSGAASLLELMKDGLPSFNHDQWVRVIDQVRKSEAGHLTKEQINEIARKGGSEHLNLQFGWAPVLSDLEKVARAAVNFNRVLEQYYRDAGRVVRRRYSFPTERSASQTVISDSALPYGATPLGTYVGPADTLDLVRNRTVVRDIWFSGAFSYYIPPGLSNRYGILGAALKAEKLLGLEITPETLWELAPWSWAFDWFSNTQEVLSNLEDFSSKGLVMRYGYLMEHTIVTDTYTRATRFPFKGENASRPVDSSISLVTETKKRVRANPFGFGISWSGLTPFQLSIAAALGLSRS